ncbi:hypothetical protein B9Y60_10525 [Stenotrophomonas maltophilia]|uniref:hypothetical protein n=1 Tax=Stenotrophomonas maltophilia TaxID=40324 RepID=UPI000C25722B|nr:hypothetical protein [Stenotrophomonas maltophilia]PJL52191.1 hypothetical protein B9Y73_10525 [Stenotrophomonas maltophilia]PJL55112.1 hypothetical protein B9Y60_10525 [Stenotrophomonas maltophilia]
MTYEEIISYRDEALTLYDAQEAADIYMVNRIGTSTQFLIVRVDELFDLNDPMAQGAVFHPHHKVMELLERGLESGKEITIDLQ